MQAWAGFAGAAAVAFAAKVGSNTYKTWLKQMQTERSLHAAEQVLTVVYKARSAIENVRAAFMPGYELDAAERKLTEGLGDQLKSVSDAQRQKLITAQAILLRIARYNETWDELPASMALAFAFLGANVEASLKLLYQQVIIIQAAAETYGKHREIEGNAEDRDFVIGLRRDMWGAWGDDKDRVGDAVAKAVADIEAVVRPILRSEAAV
jgi:hypothetical protein